MGHGARAARREGDTARVGHGASGTRREGDTARAKGSDSGYKMYEKICYGAVCYKPTQAFIYVTTQI